MLHVQLPGALRLPLHLVSFRISDGFNLSRQVTVGEFFITGFKNLQSLDTPPKIIQNPRTLQHHRTSTNKYVASMQRARNSFQPHHLLKPLVKQLILGLSISGLSFLGCIFWYFCCFRSHFEANNATTLPEYTLQTRTFAVDSTASPLTLPR